MGRRGLPVSLAVLAVCAGLVLLGPSAGSASWDQVQVKVVTIHYKTHDGYRRAAYVVLPDWYGPGNNPPLPLIISPHGRGVSAEENVDRWGNLPMLGPFAVVNPEGQGRRFRRFSWGYPGQIEDLARMPRDRSTSDSVAANRTKAHLCVRDEHGRPGDVAARRTPSEAPRRRGRVRPRDRHGPALPRFRSPPVQPWLSQEMGRPARARAAQARTGRDRRHAA